MSENSCLRSDVPHISKALNQNQRDMNSFDRGCLLILCVTYSLIAGLYPFDFSSEILRPDPRPTWNMQGMVSAVLQQFGATDFLPQRRLLLSHGESSLTCWYRREARGKTKIFLSAMLVGGCVSIVIEFAQYFSPDLLRFLMWLRMYWARLWGWCCAS